MNEVERIHQELTAIEKIVASSNDVSSIIAFGEHGAKVLLIAGASYFERQVISSIEAHVNESTESSAVKHFAYHQAVDRKFFTLFDFSASTNNINGFLSKFGDDFVSWAKADLPKAGIDKPAQIAFLDFCRLRNSLVHNNYATFAINKTLPEVKMAFDAALKFVVWVEGAFSRFASEAKNMQVSGNLK